MIAFFFAGVALLTAFGTRGLVGEPLDELTGIRFTFTSTAVVMAQLLVAAPFYVRAARAGFTSVDPQLERVAYTLGASRVETFVRITLPQARAALDAGARGYLLKDSGADSLISALRAAARGETVLAQGVAKSMTRDNGTHDPIGSLSLRERDVLQLIAEGRNNAEIANCLGIGETTVKTHVGNLLAKLEASVRRRREQSAAGPPADPESAATGSTEKAPNKKAPAKKAQTQKATARKAPVKK